MHQMVYTGKQPHACSMCDTSVSETYTLKKHQHIHALVLYLHGQVRSDLPKCSDNASICPENACFVGTQGDMSSSSIPEGRLSAALLICNSYGLAPYRQMAWSQQMSWMDRSNLNPCSTYKRPFMAAWHGFNLCRIAINGFSFR